MPYRLHLDKDGKPQLNDKGHALYLDDAKPDSAPVAFDIDSMLDDNRQKKSQAEAARKELAEAKARLQDFDGLEPARVREALRIVANLDDGKLVDAGKVDEIKRKIEAEHGQKIAGLEKALADKDKAYNDQLLQRAFSDSVYLREKTVLPADIAFGSFGKHFSVENNNGQLEIVARDSDGTTIFSPSNPGKNAGPEEAIQYLIERHPQKDTLLKAASPNGGSGSQPSGKPGGAVSKSLADCKNEAEKLAYLNSKTAA